MTWWQVENIMTIIATTALILGLYGMGAGGWAFAGGLMMLNMNSPIEDDE